MFNLDGKIKEYMEKSKKKCFALVHWSQLQMKNYRLREMLECVCNAANGSISEMDNIVDHLTAKRKVYGRTQVYADKHINNIDIIRNQDGKLELVGYKADAPLPLKGQHQAHNSKIYRKSDDQISKTYQNAEEKMFDLGAKVRELFPDRSNHFITFAMQTIRKYAADRKINPDKVIKGLKNGRYSLDSDLWRIVPNLRESQEDGRYFGTIGNNKNNDRHTIIINESDISKIKDDLEMTEQKFHSNIRHFISQLLQDPVNAQPSYIFKLYGYSRSLLLRYLLSTGILIKDEHISDKDENGDPKTVTMMIKFKCPKKDFDRKLQKLYIRLFEKNLPKGQIHLMNVDINEEGECGGAVSAGGATSASSSGQFVQPFGGLQRRKMPTEIEETTSTTNTGNYQYTVPFVGDNETLARKNGKGGSVSINEM